MTPEEAYDAGWTNGYEAAKERIDQLRAERDHWQKAHEHVLKLFTEGAHFVSNPILVSKDGEPIKL